MLLGCASALQTFPAREPLWRDPDRGSFQGPPAPYYSPHDWDRIEKSFVLPLSDFLSLRVSGEATNVNAWDEVADSSWFENRISRLALSPEELAAGPCSAPVPDPAGPWLVVSAKPDGATPGFVFEASSGQRFLAKFDGESGTPRASLAEVLGAGLFHAAGYHVPCNLIAHFPASQLELDADAEAEDALGNEVPLRRAHIDAILHKALRAPDGRYRAVISLYLEGKPLGPWRYHGLRRDDRNDIVVHEDRRELRAARLLAAWTDHVDQREGNTLAMWRETGPGRGYVMHHLLDFGDCFGSIWTASAQEIWRRGHDYWLDPRTIAVDWLALGMVERPWDRARLGPLGLTLGYYDVEQFDAEGWRPRYPNPAFSRMTERDAAWMARIIARIRPEHVRAILDRAAAPPPLHDELLRILLGRRQKILQRYLARRSPLAGPEIRRAAQGSWLCATDLAVQAGVSPARRYQARVWASGGESAAFPVRAANEAQPCVPLPGPGAARGAAAGGAPPSELLVELTLAAPASEPLPIRFHLYLGEAGWQTAGIERL